jgi:hypothetical protein
LKVFDEREELDDLEFKGRDWTARIYESEASEVDREGMNISLDCAKDD